MTHYIFAPAPSFGYGEHPFTTWEAAFTAEEIAKIVAVGDALKQEAATIGADEQNAEYRRSKVGWMDQSVETSWIFDRMASIARSLNSKFYGYDLYGFCEAFQYTTYVEGDEGHYDWHQDWGVNTSTPRKLSLVVQLTDPAEYEGGDLQILSSRETVNVLKQQGLITAFPSFMLHRVTPVTKGVRKTLVAWITGPKFQ